MVHASCLAEVFVCFKYGNGSLNMYSAFSSTYHTTIFLFHSTEDTKTIFAAYSKSGVINGKSYTAYLVYIILKMTCYGFTFVYAYMQHKCFTFWEMSWSPLRMPIVCYLSKFSNVVHKFWSCTPKCLLTFKCYISVLFVKCVKYNACNCIFRSTMGNMHIALRATPN